MEYIEETAGGWEQLTYRVLDKAPVALSEVQGLLRRSYQVLSRYHKETLVPRQIGLLIKRMDEFLYFASMMEEKETGVDFYRYQQIHTMVESMEKGFFCGHYEGAYPRLTVRNTGEEKGLVLDMEQDFLCDPDQ